MPSVALCSDLLPFLLIVPSVAAVVVALLGRGRAELVRAVSLGAVLVNLAVAGVLVVGLAGERLDQLKEGKPEETPAVGPAYFVEPAIHWSADIFRPVALSPSVGAIKFHIGLDGLNVGLIALTTLLMVPCVLVSWTSIKDRVNEYYASLLLLETAMLGVFLALDIVLFYTFFELTLIPLFLLIGIWGGPQRQHAARKFFIYTLAGSLITLLGVIGAILATYAKGESLSFQIPELVRTVQQHLSDPTEKAFWQTVEFWVFLGLSAGFAVKVPLVPLHTWLPLAHVEAPTAGSVLLAGVLLKIGAYGFLRLCVPLAPDVSMSLGTPLIGGLAVAGILYGAFCSLAQDDMKKLVAYSSVSHLGFCMLGMFALNETGLAGSLIQMINHGLSTGALFLIVGMLYERYHTRMMAEYGGMASRLKLLGCIAVFICLASLGLPGLNGFIGEMLVLTGMYDHEGSRVHGPTLAILSVFGLLFGAWYLLTLLRRVFFGALKEPTHEGHGTVPDLSYRELAALVPVAAMCLIIGACPQPFLDIAKPEVQVVARIADKARERASERRALERLTGEEHARGAASTKEDAR